MTNLMLQYVREMIIMLAVLFYGKIVKIVLIMANYAKKLCWHNLSKPRLRLEFGWGKAPLAFRSAFGYIIFNTNRNSKERFQLVCKTTLLRSSTFDESEIKRIN